MAASGATADAMNRAPTHVDAASGTQRAVALSPQVEVIRNPDRAPAIWPRVSHFSRTPIILPRTRGG
ncbi:hypothetical protein KOR34_01910 [Posidoniimonas corsicana]|uniref:Uncharacterized protein n=1 Tax=Posidoniimonas corsicana TaxID=1938618 RepID=A0A5C5VC68_9BACT|nr:hypothetical protein KOR34_01910 [Posidoniimonas corsicana]